jgi:hypothetical protein
MGDLGVLLLMGLALGGWVLLNGWLLPRAGIST